MRPVFAAIDAAIWSASNRSSTVASMAVMSPGRPCSDWAMRSDVTTQVRSTADAPSSNSPTIRRLASPISVFTWRVRPIWTPSSSARVAPITACSAAGRYTPATRWPGRSMMRPNRAGSAPMICTACWAPPRTAIPGPVTFGQAATTPGVASTWARVRCH